MSKKKLNVTSIINELEGASLFFAKPKQQEIPKESSTIPLDGATIPQTKQKTETNAMTQQLSPLRHEKKEKRKVIDDSTYASMQASKLAINQNNLIENLRKVVKTLGREVSFVRLTREEKTQLTDIVYTYKRQGIKTSENEINRIAINCLIQDYEANGENSVLAKVIAALNA